MISRLNYIVLAVWVTVASTGFNLNRHFCKDEFKGITIFSSDEFCEHKLAQKPHCKMHPLTPDDCCESEKQLFRTDDFNSNKNLFDLSINPDYLITTYFEINHFSSSTVNSYTQPENYKPPLLDPDIPVLDQSFLL